MTTYSSVLTEIYTKDEVGSLVSEINLILHEYGSTNFSSDAKKELSGKVRGSLLEMISGSQIDLDLFKNIKSEALALEEVKMTFAFQPSMDLKKKVVAKIQNEVGKKVILDSSLDSSLIGGVKISANGKYRDYSIKKVLYGEK